jgi:glycosyltransferase involved in cell wall biosynthesis
MNNQLLISVVIPMYNAEKFIRKPLEHLVHQTYKNLEIIVVDDGSSDNCADIVKQYAKHDKRIKLIQQKNAGVSAASNVGINAATGDYIHIHDHDDFVNLDYFEKMANAAVLTDADVLCGEVNQPEYNFPVFDSIEILISLSDKIEKTRANKFNPAWRYVYKTKFLRDTGLLFEPAVLGAQDILFSKPAIILADTVATVPGAIYNVVNTETALGKNKKKLKKSVTKETIAAWDRYNKFIAEHNAQELLSMPEKPYKTYEYKICNKTILRRDIYTHKIKTYLFGINIGTLHIN